MTSHSLEALEAVESLPPDDENNRSHNNGKYLAIENVYMDTDNFTAAARQTNQQLINRITQMQLLIREAIQESG